MRAGILVLAALLPGPLRADVPRPDPPSARSIEAALAALEDPDFEARAEAYERLLGWAERCPEEVLKSIPDAHADPEVEHRLDEVRRRIRFFADPSWKEALAAAGDTPQLRDALAALAGSPSAETIAGLTRAAGRHAPLFWRAYAAHLEHPDHQIRMLVLRELGRIGAVEAGPRIVQALAEDKHPRVRPEAAEALGRMRYGKAVPQLVECLRTDRRTSSAAHQAIAHIGDPSAIPLLVELLDDPLEDLRKDALRLLDGLSAADLAIAPFAAVCLDDPDEKMSACAVSLLSRIAGEDWLTGRRPEKRLQLAKEWWARREAGR